jgi:hypothetical protein
LGDGFGVALQQHCAALDPFVQSQNAGHFQRSEGFAKGRTANVKQFRQLALIRQLVSGGERTGLDLTANLFADLLKGAFGADGFEVLPFYQDIITAVDQRLYLSIRTTSWRICNPIVVRRLQRPFRSVAREAGVGVCRFDEQKSSSSAGHDGGPDQLDGGEDDLARSDRGFGATKGVYTPTNGNVRAAASNLAEVSPRTSKASGRQCIPGEPWLDPQLKGARDRGPQGRRRIDLSECDRRQYQPCGHDDRRAAHELYPVRGAPQSWRQQCKYELYHLTGSNEDKR